MDIEEKLRLITRGTAEIVTPQELKELIETKSPSGYLGFEPSGIFHVGWLVWALKFKDLVDAGVRMHLLAATWHAWINDKLGGDLELIRFAATHVVEVLNALGLEGRFNLVFAEDLVSRIEYWETLLKTAKSISLARVRRALTIMGRRLDEGEADFSKLIYPLMQVTDMFALGVDIALGGMDQRRAHMLQRDVAEKLGWKKVVAIHTPLIPSLQGIGRMDLKSGEVNELLVQAKMSKSKPETAIFIIDSNDEIRMKIRKAYCPARVVEGNPITEIVKNIIFRGEEKEFTINRPAKFGGPITVYTYEELEKLYVEGKLHPLDLKNAVAEYLIKIISPLRERLLASKRSKEFIEIIMKRVGR